MNDEEATWEGRYRSIVDFESHLHRNGTRIVKIFLHISNEEQRKRFLARIDEPDKNWKFSLADIRERMYWKHYMKAFEACFKATSTHHAPWYVVPADDKENARLIVSGILLNALGDLKMPIPKTTAKRRAELTTNSQAPDELTNDDRYSAVGRDGQAEKCDSGRPPESTFDAKGRDVLHDVNG